MAFSKTPQTATYDTKRVGFISNPQQRNSSTTKDFRLTNVMTEVLTSPLGEGKKFLIKSRPGMLSTYSQTTGRGRGLYYWVISGVGYIFYVIGNRVYSNNTLVLTLTTSSGEVGFTEFLNSAGTVTLVLLDGTKGYIFTNGAGANTEIGAASETAWTATTLTVVGDQRRPTVSNGYVYYATIGGTTGGAQPVWPVVVGNTVVDGTVTWRCALSSFPTPHIPTPIFLDGYLFVAKANSSDIYNSDLDNAGSWIEGEFTSAEMYPDTIVGLCKNANYICALGSSSVEYYYDAGNAAGSPLSRHEAAVLQMGCVSQGTIVSTNKEYFFVGETQDGNHSVWMVDGFKAEEISIPSIKSALLNEGNALFTATAHVMRVAGQKLYLICLTTRTLVYSLDTKMWHEWASGPTNGQQYISDHSTDGPGGSSYTLGRSSGKVYTCDANYFTDDGLAFMCEIVSSKMDFDSINKKFMYRLSLIGDVPDSSGVNNNFTIAWSDDDYNTWSPNRTITLKPDLPSMFQLGTFRRRAFRIQYSQPYLMRLEGIEVDINKGVS